MSSIAGIWYWDGRPIANADLTAMAFHLRAAGPDGGGSVEPVPGLAMQAHVLHFDRLSQAERQPHIFERDRVLTWDGRLDNRDDLLITLHRDLGSDITDAALVAAAFARLGFDCISRLVGDWSLAIWDAPNRQIVLARDYMGNRPLYYLELPGGLAWASNLDALVDCFDLYGSADESYIAGTLTSGVPSDLTPFVGVRLLRSGHIAIASQGNVHIRRYWTFQPSQIRYRNQGDYSDHLRSLLTDAIRVRLRASGRVWAHLSGGFDSSSIVCIARRLMERTDVEAQDLQPLAQVVTASPESDESTYIEAVERWCRLTAVKREFSSFLPTFEQLLTQRRPFFYGVDTVFEAPMVTAGDRIVLSGELGDLVMVRASSQFVSLLEPLHEGRVRFFLQCCFAWARRRRRPFIRVLAWLLLSGYAPRFYDRLQHRANERTRTRDHLAPGGLTRADVSVTPRMISLAPTPESPYPSVSEFAIAKRALVSDLYTWTDIPANADSTPEIWRTLPFSHRPLCEFVVGAPQLAFWDPMTTRAGMKRALRDVLPPEILARRSKGDPTTALTRASIAAREDFLLAGIPHDPPEQWQLVLKGYVHARSLTAALAALSGGEIPLSSSLRTCVQLEAWLRNVALMNRRASGASVPPPQRVLARASRA